MIKKAYNTYAKYCDSINELRTNNQNQQEEKYDRKRMKMQLKCIVDSINFKNITDEQDFITPLKKFGFNRNDKKLFILAYSNYINVSLLKKRELDKSNDMAKNILLNKLASENPENFFSFFKFYVYRNYSYKPYIENLLKDYRSKIDQLKKQTFNKTNSVDLSQILN